MLYEVITYLEDKLKKLKECCGIEDLEQTLKLILVRLKVSLEDKET